MGMLSETDIGLGTLCLLQETTTGWAKDWDKKMWKTERKTNHMMITKLEVAIEKILKLLPQTMKGKEGIIYG